MAPRSSAVRRSSNKIGVRRSSFKTGAGSSTAVMYMRFPSLFSAVATDSRISLPSNGRIIRHLFDKTHTVGRTGVVVAFAGRASTWAHLIDELRIPGLLRKFKPPYLEVVTAECVRIINRYMEGVTAGETTTKEKLAAAEDNAIELLVLDATGARIITLNRKSRVGAHGPNNVTSTVFCFGSGKTILDDYWVRLRNNGGLYEAVDGESQEAHVERVMRFMYGGVHLACKGHVSCGGKVDAKATNADRLVRHRTFKQVDDTYTYCLAPYTEESRLPDVHP